MVRAERIWSQALQRSGQARASGALVPLATETLLAAELSPFVLRRLLSRTPKHLRREGPKPNPFLPWEPALEVQRLTPAHVVLLNKYPVQPGHLLVISEAWRPQAGWLERGDWQAVGQLSADTGGLWFFNSCAAAGASQPHRHLQLLPRAAGEISCPLAGQLQSQLQALDQSKPSSWNQSERDHRGDNTWPWAYRISRRHDPRGGSDLEALYLEHAASLGLGSPQHDPQPRHPYNLLFDDDWLMTVRRNREHCAGFSLNALAFAGYLLATEGSDLNWLLEQGPWPLLQAVATPAGEAR